MDKQRFYLAFFLTLSILSQSSPSYLHFYSIFTFFYPIGGKGEVIWKLSQLDFFYVKL